MKTMLAVIAVIILLFIIKNNMANIIKTLEDENTAGNLKKKIAEEQRQNQFLRERLFYVKTNQFVEKEAREKLGLSKPGEYIVIAPNPTPLNRNEAETDTRPNWQKWLELFF
jgi:cell division protein FtsB